MPACARKAGARAGAGDAGAACGVLCWCDRRGVSAGAECQSRHPGRALQIFDQNLANVYLAQRRALAPGFADPQLAVNVTDDLMTVWNLREPSGQQRMAWLMRAVEIAGQTKQKTREANCINSLGDVHVRLAEYPAARQRCEEALPIYRAIGDRLGEANCIRSLGDVHVSLAEYAQARQRYEEALPIYRTIGARLGEANCIRSLGNVHVSLAEYAQARQRYEEALPIYRTIGNRLGEANCIQSLGDVHRPRAPRVPNLGNDTNAVEAYEDAYHRFQTLGLPNQAASVLTSWTTVYDQKHDYAASLPLYSKAIQLSPSNPMWYRNRASLYINLRDAANAFADLKVASTFNPIIHICHYDTAILPCSKATTEAEDLFRTFIEAIPANNGGYFGLARALLCMERDAEALDALEQAISLTYSAQDIHDASYDLEQLQADHPSLSGIEPAIQRLQSWLQSSGQ
ncbi:MAG: tetratricopeptide repeat protein [Anaerolineales bacterium]|nr:tetratricopeptide repeat protein [Anaerolineales bacterium]